MNRHAAVIRLRPEREAGYRELHDRDLAAMAADPDTQAWWRLTDPCQQPVPTAGPGEKWAPLEEVFHVD